MKKFYLGLAALTLVSMNLNAQCMVAKKDCDPPRGAQCCGMYGEYCEMVPEYFQTYRCEMEPIEVPVQKVRYIKKYFQKECCRLVPEKYTVTQMIREPEYYTDTEVQYQPKWFVDTHCRMVPKKYLKPVCRPKPCDCEAAPDQGNSDYYQAQLNSDSYYQCFDENSQCAGNLGYPEQTGTEQFYGRCE